MGAGTGSLASCASQAGPCGGSDLQGGCACLSVGMAGQSEAGSVFLVLCASVSPPRLSGLPHRVIYRLALKPGWNGGSDMVRVLSPRRLAQWPGPCHLSDTLEPVSSLWVPVRLGKMALPEFPMVGGPSGSQQLPSDSDVPRGAGFLYMSGTPPEWPSQSALGSNPTLPLPLPPSDLEEVTASGLPRPDPCSTMRRGEVSPLAAAKGCREVGASGPRHCQRQPHLNMPAASLFRDPEFLFWLWDLW